VEKPSDRFETNQEVRVKILRMDPTEKKIGLSIRAADVDAAKAELADYKGRATSVGEGTVTLGDVAQDLVRLKEQAEGSQAETGEEAPEPPVEETAQPQESGDDIQDDSGEEATGEAPEPPAEEAAQPQESGDDIQDDAGEEAAGEVPAAAAEETETKKTDDA
jgi:small subunit ribosomal protein S1